MNLTIRNLRGIESADIDLQKITLIGALNGAGKTSISLAAAACLMRTASPLPEMLAKDARLLLRDGQSRGSASLNGVTINWPGGTVSGESFQYSGIVAGVESLATMPAKERTPWLIANLKAKPTPDELRAALQQIGLPDKAIDAVCQSVTESGWDGALARAKENGTKAKGAWESITGERYGAQKATAWRPLTLTVDDPDAINAEVSRAQHAYDVAVASTAVAQSEIDRLTAMAARIDNLVTAYDAEAEKLDALERTEKAAADTLARTPKPGQPETTCACPECGAVLVAVSATELRAPLPVTKDNGAYRAAIAAHTSAATALRMSREAVASAARERNAAMDAKARLENLPESPEGTQEDAADNLRKAQEQALDYRRMTDAASQHKAVERAVTIAGVLAPDGLRQSALDGAVVAMNDSLGAITERAGWQKIAVHVDGRIEAAGRPYALLSASEQFRVRVTLQIWQAAAEAAPVVVIDAADILDGKGRAGLMRALSGTPALALVTMTYDSRDKMPAARDGFGVHWIEGGAVK
jgi:hypothetical protein